MDLALSHLLSWLDLRPAGLDRYKGPGPGGTRRRLFGGHVAAQALVAAGRCVPDTPAHSLHVYFLRLGDPHSAIEYRVERLRDGRSYKARLVRALQHGEEILVATASFVQPEQTDHHTLVHQARPPEVPPPAACSSWQDWAGPRLAEMPAVLRQQYERERPIEIRMVAPNDACNPAPAAAQQQFWFRAPAQPGELGEDPLLHQALATYASDHTLLSAVLRPHGINFMSRGVLAASVDHTIWFHRPFRMDQWLLYSQDAPVAFAGRGLAFGHFFDEHANLVASMAQEGVVRRH